MSSWRKYTTHADEGAMSFYNEALDVLIEVGMNGAILKISKPVAATTLFEVLANGDVNADGTIAGAGSGSNIVKTDVDDQFSGLTQKASPVAGDFLILESAADGGAKRKVDWDDLPAGGGGGVSSFDDLDDVPSYSGNGDKILVIKATEDGVEVIETSAGGNGATDGGKVTIFGPTGNLTGRCDASYGVKGISANSAGVEGESTNGAGGSFEGGGVNGAVVVTQTGSGLRIAQFSNSADSATVIITSEGGLQWLTGGGAAQTRTNLGLVIGTDVQGVLSEGAFVDGDKTKLDGIESGADVTDATNVAAAGALMTADAGALATLDTVRTSEIDADAVTNNELANMSASTIKGRRTASGGDPEDLDADAVSDILETATDPFVRTSALSGAVDQIDFESVEPGDDTITLRLYAHYAFTINELRIKTASGTCTVAVKIDGTDVTGISAVAVSSTEATGTATAANSVSVGQTVTLVISSSSSVANLVGSLKFTR